MKTRKFKEGANYHIFNAYATTLLLFCQQAEIVFESIARDCSGGTMMGAGGERSVVTFISYSYLSLLELACCVHSSDKH